MSTSTEQPVLVLRSAHPSVERIDRSPHAAVPASPSSTHVGRTALIVGVLSSLVSSVAMTVPSLWGDEVASISSAERSWPQLAAMLHNIDVVHGAYYALLKLWIGVAGESAFSVRLPSVLAVGLAAAGVFLLVSTLVSSRAGFLAATAFTFMPRISYVGIDARSVALATAAAVWLTILAVRLARRRSGAGWWVLYALGFAASTYLYVYLAFLLPVHIVIALLLARRRGDGRMPRWGWAPWLAAWVVAGLLAVPMFVAAYRQRGQISFLLNDGVPQPPIYLVAQWFSHYYVAVPAWLLILTAAITVVLRSRSVVAMRVKRAVRRLCRPLLRSTRITRMTHAMRPRLRRALGPEPLLRSPRATGALVVAALVWMILPTLVLVLATVAGHASYSQRYLAFCTPAVAALMGIGAAELLRTPARALIGALVIIALCLPTWVFHRLPYSNGTNTDWQSVASLVASQKRPGDGIVFDESVTRALRPRLATYAYPAAFRGVADPELVTPMRDRPDHLLDLTSHLYHHLGALSALRRVWIVDVDPDTSPSDVRTLREHGFHLVSRHHFAADTVYLYARGAAR